MKLTKCMFSDPACKAFGLSNNQIRGTGIINSAGWFNLDGERIGNGDLSTQDMATIAKTISSDDLFIVLKEVDAKMDFPANLDYLSPGKDYVCTHAVWMIGRDVGGKSTILRIRDDIETVEMAKQDGVEYMRIPRKEMYRAINYTPPAKKAKPKDVDDKKMDGLKKAATSLKSAMTKSSPANPAPSPTSPAKPVATSQVKGIGKPFIPTAPTPPIPAPPPFAPIKKKVVKKSP